MKQTQNKAYLHGGLKSTEPRPQQDVQVKERRRSIFVRFSMENPPDIVASCFVIEQQGATKSGGSP